MKNEYYSYDKIQILFKQSIEAIENSLPINELRKNSYSPAFYFGEIRPNKCSKGAYRAGYKTFLTITAPTKTAFQILAHSESFVGEYTIFSIEILKEILFDSFNDSEMFIACLSRYVRLFYSKYKEIIEDITLYTGKRKRPLNFVAYGDQPSKVFNIPSARHEFRLKRFHNIKEKVKIHNFTDLLYSDPEQLYKNLEKEYIRYECINYIKLGLFLLNIKTRKPSKAKRCRASFYARKWCYDNNIYNTVDLINIADRKSKGRKSDQLKRLSTIKDYRRFIKPCSFSFKSLLYDYV